MQHFTGMGPNTSSHFVRIGALIDNDLYNRGGQNLQPIHGQVFQAPPLVAPAYGSHYHQNVPQSSGYHGVNDAQMGEIGRHFMRNLFR